MGRAPSYQASPSNFSPECRTVQPDAGSPTRKVFNESWLLGFGVLCPACPCDRPTADPRIGARRSEPRERAAARPGRRLRRPADRRGACQLGAAVDRRRSRNRPHADGEARNLVGQSDRIQIRMGTVRRRQAAARSRHRRNRRSWSNRWTRATRSASRSPHRTPAAREPLRHPNRRRSSAPTPKGPWRRGSR